MPHATIANTAIPDSLKTTSLFKEHLLTTKNTIYKFHYTHYDYLAASILLFSFLLFVWLYASYFKRLNNTIKGFFINRFANQFSRDEFSFGNRVTVFLSIMFVFMITLFVSQTVKYYYGFGGMASDFFQLNVIVAVIILLIYLSNLLLSNLWDLYFMPPNLHQSIFLPFFFSVMHLDYLCFQ